MSTYKNIERLYNVVYKSIARIDSNLSYPRTLEAINRLCDAINTYYDNEENQDECIWYIGESNEFSLDSLIVGAYWFTSDYQAFDRAPNQEAITQGQLSTVFSPNCSGLEEDSGERDVYDFLEAKRNES
jgi:hypothetical protein